MVLSAFIKNHDPTMSDFLNNFFASPLLIQYIIYFKDGGDGATKFSLRLFYCSGNHSITDKKFFLQDILKYAKCLINKKYLDKDDCVNTSSTASVV